MATEIGRLVAIIDGDFAGLQKAISGASRTLQTAGRSMTEAGKLLTAGLTVPIVGIGVVAAKASIDFESAFAGVRKTVEATAEELEALRKGIRGMAKEMPASAVEIAKVAEAAGQLGIKTENILDFTRVMVMLGETTNLSSDEAATAMARLANIMQTPQDQFEKLGATLVDLGNKGASTEAEIVEMALRIAGAGKQIGLTEDEVLAFANALSSVGIEAQAGGSGISRAFIEIANAVAMGGEKLETFSSVAGMSADEFSKAFKEDPALAMVSFIEGLREMSDEGGNVFAVLKDLSLGEIRVRDALLRAANAGDLFRQSLKDGKTAWEDGSALAVEYGKRVETTAAQLEILKGKLMDAAITLGDALVPAMMDALEAAQPLLDVMVKLAEAFANLPRPMQTVIVSLALIVALIGPLLIALGTMTTGFGTLMTALKILPVLFGALSVAVAATGMSFGALLIAAAPWVILIGVIAAALYLLIFRFDEVKAAAAKAAAFIKKNWAELGTVFAPLAAALALPFLAIAVLAGDAFGIRSKLLEALSSLKDKAGELAGQVASAIGNAFAGATSAVGGAVSGGLGAIGGFFSGLASGVTSAFESAKAAVSEGVSSLIATLTKTLTAENLGRAVAWSLLFPVYLLRKSLEALIPIVIEFFGSTLPKVILDVIPSAVASIAQFTLALGASLLSAFVSFKEGVGRFFRETIPSLIGEAVPAVISALSDLAVKTINALVDSWVSQLKAVKTFYTSTLPKLIKESAQFLYDTAIELGTAFIDSFINGIEAKINLVESIPGTIADAVKDAFNALDRFWTGTGQAIVEGIWNGVKSMKDWFMGQFRAFLTGIWDEAKSIFGFGSPSRVFKELGVSLVEGFALGIKGFNNISLAPQLSSIIDEANGALDNSLRSGASLFTQARPPMIPWQSMVPAGSYGSGAQGEALGFEFVSNGTINIYDDKSRDIEDNAFAAAVLYRDQLRRRGYPV